MGLSNSAVGAKKEIQIMVATNLQRWTMVSAWTEHFVRLEIEIDEMKYRII